MITTIKSRNVWTMCILLAMYFIIAPYISRQMLFDILNGLSIASAIGVIIAFYPSVSKRLGTWRWFMLNNLDGAHYFAAALCGVEFYVIMRHGYNAIWRLVIDINDPYQNSLTVGFMIWFITVINYVFIMAIDLEKGHIPTRNWWWVGVTSIAGLSLGCLILSVLEPYPPHWLTVLFNHLVW